MERHKAGRAIAKFSKLHPDDKEVSDFARFQYYCRYHEKEFIPSGRLGNFFYLNCPKKEEGRCILMIVVPEKPNP